MPEWSSGSSWCSISATAFSSTTSHLWLGNLQYSILILWLEVLEGSSISRRREQDPVERCSRDYPGQETCFLHQAICSGEGIQQVETYQRYVTIQELHCAFLQERPLVRWETEIRMQMVNTNTVLFMINLGPPGISSFFSKWLPLGLCVGLSHFAGAVNLWFYLHFDIRYYILGHFYQVRLQIRY